MVSTPVNHKWGMVVDLDRCTGCQACVVACQSENNLPINTKDRFLQGRAFEWIRIERYWEGDYPNVKARHLPVLCQHCENAPCEPVCPVFATYHNNWGQNIQLYNRCVGTRYCANNCPYQVRFFNYWEPVWPETFRNYLNTDVTVRSRGIMEKCSFCVQRLRRAQMVIERQRGERISDENLKANNLMPACVMACPANVLQFGDQNDETSQIYPHFQTANERLAHGYHEEESEREYRMLLELGTKPNVIYLKKYDPYPVNKGNGHGA